MRTTRDDRLLRALKLLEAAHHPKAGPLLAGRGFDDEARAEGWTLVERTLGRCTPAPAAPAAPLAGDSELLQAIDRWENTWFDVADAALTRLAPALRDRLFDQLHKRQRRAVLASVAKFLDRLDAFDHEAKSDPTIARALVVLRRRGLTHQQRQHGRDMLAQLEAPDATTANCRDIDLRDRAREKLWSWYKDWAKTARTIVDDPKLRIAIGLSRPRDTPDSNSADGTTS